MATRMIHALRQQAGQLDGGGKVKGARMWAIVSKS